ncbi:MAG: hypothetical protein AAFX06_20735 [Planctomycetota bacterium]
MSTVFAEQPLLIAIMIAFLVAALGYGWLESGDKRMGLAAVAMACLIPGAFYMGHVMVTDREQILDIISTTAEAIEANDHDAAVAVISDEETRQRAVAELPRYEFSHVRAGNIKITMIEGSFPPEATVDIDASVVASQARGPIKNQRVVRRLILTLTKEGDDWLVTDYTHLSLNGQADNFTPNRL